MSLSYVGQVSLPCIREEIWRRGRVDELTRVLAPGFDVTAGVNRSPSLELIASVGEVVKLASNRCHFGAALSRHRIKHLRGAVVASDNDRAQEIERAQLVHALEIALIEIEYALGDHDPSGSNAYPDSLAALQSGRLREVRVSLRASLTALAQN